MADYLDWLDVGQAIVSLKGRVKVPLHVRFQTVNVKKGLIHDVDLSNELK